MKFIYIKDEMDDDGGHNESAGQLIASTSGRSLEREAVIISNDIHGSVGDEEGPDSFSNESAKTDHQENWNIIVGKFLENDSPNVWGHRYDPTSLENPEVEIPYDEEVEEIFRDQRSDYFGTELETSKIGIAEEQIDAADEDFADAASESWCSESKEDRPLTFTMNVPVRPIQDDDPVAVIQAQLAKASNRIKTGPSPHGSVEAEDEGDDWSEVPKTISAEDSTNSGVSQLDEIFAADLSLIAISKYKQLHWAPGDEKSATSTEDQFQDVNIQDDSREESKLRKKMLRKASIHMVLRRTLMANDSIKALVTTASMSTASSGKPIDDEKCLRGFKTRLTYRDGNRKALQKHFEYVCRHLDVDGSYETYLDTEIFGEESAQTKTDQARERVKSRLLDLRKPLATSSEEPMSQIPLARSVMLPKRRASSHAAFDFWEAERSAQQVNKHHTHVDEDNKDDASESLLSSGKECSLRTPELNRQLAKDTKLAKRQAITEASFAAGTLRGRLNVL